MPPLSHHPAGNKQTNKHKIRLQPLQKDDVELATKIIDRPRTSPRVQDGEDFSHYGIAKDMVHFQSNDIGERCEYKGVECSCQY